MAQIGSVSSLGSFHSKQGDQWKRVSGLSMTIKDNQQQTQIQLKQDAIAKFLDPADKNIQIDIGFFRYTANQTFVDARKLANGGNDTAFYCIIQNSSGSYDQYSRATQFLGASTFYVYEFINKVGQYADIALTNKLVIGFGHFDKETVYINAPIDFGTTHYYLNVFIE